MTEADYLASDDPDAMLAAVGDRLSQRKLVLFVCACCRAVPFKATDAKARRAIDLIEQAADGLVPMAKVAEFAESFQQNWAARPFLFSGSQGGGGASLGVLTVLYQLALNLTGESDEDEPFVEIIGGLSEHVRSKPSRQARLLREVAGNPFRPAAFDPAWRTSTVAALVEAIVADRAFDRFPILADALEDAGCTDVELLAHFRAPGTHVRGCWALDLVLGKS